MNANLQGVPIVAKPEPRFMDRMWNPPAAERQKVAAHISALLGQLDGMFCAEYHSVELSKYSHYE